MSFKLHAIENDNWEILLFDEPSYIQGLKMAPQEMEPELLSGIWLVVVFPIWSVPVRHSVLAAIECAKQQNGLFRLGIRPFDSYDEMRRWWPTNENIRQTEACIFDTNKSDPSWLVMKEGNVHYLGNGAKSSDQLTKLMQSIV